MKYRITQDGFGFNVEVRIIWFWVDAQIFCEYSGFDTIDDARDYIKKRTIKTIVIA
jgi:hypothetical protein